MHLRWKNNYQGTVAQTKAARSIVGYPEALSEHDGDALIIVWNVLHAMGATGDGLEEWSSPRTLRWLKFG
jgi:hypothetical protein